MINYYPFARLKQSQYFHTIVMNYCLLRKHSSHYISWTPQLLLMMMMLNVINLLVVKILDQAVDYCTKINQAGKLKEFFTVRYRYQIWEGPDKVTKYYD